MADDPHRGENESMGERLKKPSKQRVVPKLDQPGPPRHEGDATPNPFPDHLDTNDEDGGDPGRT